MKKIVFILYLFLFFIIVNFQIIINIKTKEKRKHFVGTWKKVVRKKRFIRKKYPYPLKTIKQKRKNIIRAVRRNFFPFSDKHRGCPQRGQPLKKGYLSPIIKRKQPCTKKVQGKSPKRVSVPKLSSFFNFSGSRTTVIRLAKNNSPLNSSNVFTREDYLKLNISGKNKMQNIKANIFESNSVMDKLNKSSIEVDTKNFSLFFGENQMSLEENELVLDQKTITGIDIKSKHKYSNFRFLSGQLQGQTIEEEINGNGTHGPYALKIKPIIAFSEEVKLNNIKLQQNYDYVIDYELGFIKFPNKFIKNTDKIYLRYESQEKINKNVLALQSNINPFPFLNLGFTYLKQFSPKLDVNNSILSRNLYGIKCNLDFNNDFGLHSFLAFQKIKGNSKMASATKLSFYFKRPFFRISTNYKNIGTDFKSLGSSELYSGSNMLNMRLSFQNNYIQGNNEYEEKKGPQNYYKRYALCKLNFIKKRMVNFGYSFKHEKNINNNTYQNYSKIKHKALLNLDRSFFNWRNSFTYSRNNHGFLLDQVDHNFGKKSSITLRKRSCILNIYYENIIKKRKNKNLNQSNELGISLELNPFSALRFKTNYNHYSHLIDGKSSHLYLNYRLTWPLFFLSSGRLNLKTITSNQSSSLQKNTSISGILKFNFLPSEKLSLEYSYLPQITKNEKKEIIKDNSINQLNFFLAPSDSFSLHFGIQNKTFLNKSSQKFSKLQYKSYLLQSSIRTKKCFSLEGRLYYDKKFENTHDFFKKTKGNLEILFKFKHNKTFGLGLEFENERQLITKHTHIQLTTKSLFSSFQTSNKNNTFNLKTTFKTSLQNDSGNKSYIINPSVELTFKPKPNLESYVNYSYSKSFQDKPAINEKLEASLNTHFNKFFDFKFTASYNKSTSPPAKYLNLEGVFTTSF